MERLTQSQKDKLSRYADGMLSAVESEKIESELARSEAMRDYLAVLKLIGHTLSQRKMEVPSRNFTEMVMSKLHEYPVKSSGISTRNGIFLLIGVLLAVGIASILVVAGVFDGTITTLDLSNYKIPGNPLKKSLPTIFFNGKLVVDIIILMNLGLAWLVLDRAVLKPYFQRRMRTAP